MNEMPGKHEKKLTEKIACARPADRQAAEACRRHWDSLAKPLDGLGRFEEILVRLAGIQGSPDVKVRPAAAVVMCADHGVTCENVTQTDSSVTASVAKAIAEGRSTVNAMADAAGMPVYAVDIGMYRHERIDGLTDCCVSRGTKDIMKEPAMSREDACRAVLEGIGMVERMSGAGYRILAAGEMGIGNTTAASAVITALSGLDSAEVTGRGAGLPDDLYAHKIEIVREAVRRNRPDREDPLDLLAKLGGFDMAGMTGMYIGGAVTGTLIVIDGFISAVSALLAKSLCPLTADYMAASHKGREPASGILMDMLGEKPVLDAGMALGEATGAVMLLPLLDVALALYRNGESFDEIRLEPYERFSSL